VNPAMLHCMSFDVEEHFQVSAFDSPMRRRHWDQFESRVERNTRCILDVLAQRNVHATFFILGWIAERHQDFVREIARQGHENACHGYGHELLLSQTPDQFRTDIRRAKAILEDITGRAVLGYRAPSFTIMPETGWSLPILVEEGFVYDSSVFPVVHDRYGFPDARPDVHRMMTSAGPLWEVPPSTVKVMGVRISAAGGGYLRVYPFAFFRWLLRRIEAQGQPLVIYSHPWEYDPAQPPMHGSWFSRFRHYTNLDKTKSRLETLLNEFSFAPIREAIEPIRQIYQQQGKDGRAARHGRQTASTPAGHHVFG